MLGSGLQILVVVLGQELPEETADTAQQVFGLVVAAIGLAAFALVLALVEQVVLQILDDNVRRGSRVFESGHVSGLLLVKPAWRCTEAAGSAPDHAACAVKFDKPCLLLRGLAPCHPRPCFWRCFALEGVEMQVRHQKSLLKILLCSIHIGP